ncbi:hypothetical protein CHS0354_004537 [Potamilus streckersoni]|uniref:RING-type domain-containing protein n=1 Tax=Potamilus streckersoni TaxID=2493646 RepID=A0AAE0S572_9BIVA|nr:hypothetical protein CHS0354_004537 [Potamilus streckersoni]
MYVHCLRRLLGRILGYFRLLLITMFPIFASSYISETGKKYNDQNKESNVFGHECHSGNKIKGRESGKGEWFNLTNTKSRYGTDACQPHSMKKKVKHNISARTLRAKRSFRRKTIDKFLKRNIFVQKRDILKQDIVDQLRSNYYFCNSFLTYPIQGRSISDSRSTSSELDDDTELRMEDEISGVVEGFPIQCEEDNLHKFPILEESVVRQENSRNGFSSLIAIGGPISSNGSRHFLDSQFGDHFINMHPETPINGIQAEHDQQNAEFYLQAARAFQALLECEQGWYDSRFSQVIDHDLIYQDFLNDPDRNVVRNPVQVMDEKSTSDSGFPEVTGLNMPGTESGHATMYRHSPFDGGTERSEAERDEDQGATGGTRITDDVVRNIRRRTLCTVCKKHDVEVKFEACGHAVCCFKCASGIKQ